MLVTLCLHAGTHRCAAAVNIMYYYFTVDFHSNPRCICTGRQFAGVHLGSIASVVRN